MTVFNKITFESLKKNRTRTVVTIIGVALSAAMITAVVTILISLQSYLINDTIARTGNWHIRVQNADVSLVEQLKEDNEIKNLSTINYSGSGFLTDDGSFKSSIEVTPDEANDYMFFFIYEFTDETFDMIPLKITAGRLPQNNNEVIVPERFLDYVYFPYEIGDTFDLAYYAYTSEYTIVGFYESLNNTESGILSISDFITKEADLDYAIYSHLYLTLENPYNVYDYVRNTFGHDLSVEYKFNTQLLRFMGISTNELFLAVILTLGIILITLIIVGSILLIYNSFNISVSERARQFGILSSVGATRWQLIKSVLFEGICIGLIGIPLGILSGTAGIGITLNIVGGLLKNIMESEVTLSLVVSPLSFLGTAFLSVITILISALIPAIRATRKSAIEIIRQANDIKIKPKTIKTSKLVHLLFGLEGILALKNFKRNKKSYHSTSVSLFVSIVLFISASSFVLYLKKGVETTVADYGYDISVKGFGSMAEAASEEDILALYNRLKNAEGIYDSVYNLQAYYNGLIPASLFSDKIKIPDGEKTDFTVTICYVEDDVYYDYLKELGLSADEYSVKNGKLPAVARVKGYNPTRKLYESYNIFNTKTVPVELYNNYRSLTLMITEKMPRLTEESMSSGFYAFAPYSEKGKLKGAERQIEMNFLSSNSRESEKEMWKIIRSNRNISGYYLFNFAYMLESNRSLIMIINIFTYGFVILISLIAIANVFNTTSTGINLRRREFAMLRSVGLDNRSFNRMMNFECLFYGFRALAYGLPVSGLVTWVIYKALAQGVETPFMLPWSSIAVSIFSVFFVVFVTMVYAVHKIKKANVIETLRNDTI